MVKRRLKRGASFVFNGVYGYLLSEGWLGDVAGQDIQFGGVDTTGDGGQDQPLKRPWPYSAYIVHALVYRQR